MKKYLFTLLMAVSAITVKGQNMVAKAILFSEEGYPFQVVMNGLIQNATPGTNVQIPVSAPGPFKIKILFRDTALGVISDKIYMEPGMEQTYSISLKKYNDAHKAAKSLGSNLSYHFTNKSTKEYKEEQKEIENLDSRFVIRMLSKIPMNVPPPQPTTMLPPQQPAPAVQYSQQTTVVQPAPAVTHTTTTVTTSPGAVTGGSIGMSAPGISMNLNVGGVATTQQTTTTTTSTGYTQTQGMAQTQQVYVMPGYSGPTGCPWPMQQNDFTAAKNSIASKGFEDSKLTIAKQIIASNCLFASQVREVMGLFDFEQTKLDFAKFAYGYTYDIGNYFKVNDAFDFESSIQELNNYIAGRGR